MAVVIRDPSSLAHPVAGQREKAAALSRVRLC
jgi:hypothetical protein